MKPFQVIALVILPNVLACLGAAISMNGYDVPFEIIQSAWAGIWLMNSAGILAGYKWVNSVKDWALAYMKSEQDLENQKISNALSLLLANCDKLSSETRGILELERERLKL